MTALPPSPVPPLVKALRDVREMLHRAVRIQNLREVEAAIERINAELDRKGQKSVLTRSAPSQI